MMYGPAYSTSCLTWHVQFDFEHGGNTLTFWLGHLSTSSVFPLPFRSPCCGRQVLCSRGRSDITASRFLTDARDHYRLRAHIVKQK